MKVVENIIAMLAAFFLAVVATFLFCVCDAIVTFIREELKDTKIPWEYKVVILSLPIAGAVLYFSSYVILWH